MQNVFKSNLNEMLRRKYKLDAQEAAIKLPNNYSLIQSVANNKSIHRDRRPGRLAHVAKKFLTIHVLQTYLHV